MNQLHFLKQLTGVQRLNQALSLSDTVRSFARQNIIDTNPGISKKDVAKKLFERISYGKRKDAKSSTD